MAVADHPPVTGRSRRLLAVLLVPLVAAAVAGAVAWWPDGSGDRPELAGTPLDATVVEARQAPCADTAPEAGIECLRVEVRLAGGGRVALEEQPGPTSDAERVAVGDEVVVSRQGQGADVRYELEGRERTTTLGLAALAAAAALVVIARWRGLLLVAALAVAGGALVAFAIPAVLDGAPPAGVAATTGGLVAVVLVVLGRGFDARHLTALAGSLLSLAAAAGIAVALSEATSASVLRPVTPQLADLLVVGMVVGATGALVGLATRLVDATWDLRDADPDARWLGLVRAGMRRGRAAYSDVSATVVLAYAGAALPLLTVLLADQPVLDVLQRDDLAVQLVLAFTAVLALATVVPLTAAVAALVLVVEGRRRDPEDPRRFRTKKEREIWG